MTRLRLVQDDPDQVPRLMAFRALYPRAIIGMIESGCWQARLPEENGETVITRYSLHDLLDKLDEICAPAAEGALTGPRNHRPFRYKRNRRSI